ncbi:TlpA family protein disulfide reductase [Frigoriflavimonas asaccharolytica]|uniref:Thiol-disulfide isomerase/thioredoxin n=1 Tax=Frigoriflavimonas asaccharolytica TaxID=2735899 RepID=A0A8J8G6S1_9FLAO|nr:TlpA disulfide reductase family protein [Frigoriflavimonas asaccharolytica]NRS92533.1 thiol-disulfide isomerase/thioredoxin [Frigoriflavimonas asaccharolytica]
MKKLSFIIAVSISTFSFAQFSVQVEANPNYSAKEAILFTLDGSKDIISSKESKSGNIWKFKVPQNYKGMMKIYFPEINYSFNLISENKDVSVKLTTTSDKVEDVIYLDQANILMDEVQDLQNKNELIFPALVQIKDYYSPNSTFGGALRNEIDRLGKTVSIDAQKNPFVYYYNTNYNKYTISSSVVKPPTQTEIVDFISKSGEMLETSSLLRPILVNYLNAATNANSEQAVDTILNKLVLETPRGQTVLSEFIDIFSAYGMVSLKDKYLTKAKDLKCTINTRLAKTLKSNANVELGAIFPNYIFSKSVTNTNLKSIADVKNAKKVIMFWASTCSHCEKDLPIILGKYTTLKSNNVEVIGLSLDSDKTSYDNKVKALPWINDSELRGWNSSYSETYNITATPTYFILDSNNKIIAKPDSISDVFTFLGVK